MSRPRARPRARGGSGGAPFTPASISGLSLWLDASDTSTITQSAGAVSQWNDKSTELNHATQGTSANQPTTNTRTINGRNVLDFDGSNDFFDLPSGLYNINQADNALFMVIQQDTTGNASLFDGKQAGFSNRIYGLRSDTSGTRYSFMNGNYGNDALLTTTYDSNAHIYVGRRNALGTNGVQIFKDGVIGATLGTGAANTALDQIVISKHFGGSFDFLNGAIAEIIIYRGTKTNGELNQVGNYLASKWGITWTNI